MGKHEPVEEKAGPFEGTLDLTSLLLVTGTGINEPLTVKHNHFFRYSIRIWTDTSNVWLLKWLSPMWLLSWNIPNAKSSQHRSWCWLVLFGCYSIDEESFKNNFMFRPKPLKSHINLKLRPPLNHTKKRSLVAFS